MVREDNFVYEKPRNIFTLINEENRRNAEVIKFARFFDRSIVVYLFQPNLT